MIEAYYEKFFCTALGCFVCKSEVSARNVAEFSISMKRQQIDAFAASTVDICMACRALIECLTPRGLLNTRNPICMSMKRVIPSHSPTYQGRRESIEPFSVLTIFSKRVLGSLESMAVPVVT